MENFVNFFFETGALKRAKRSGWWLINIKDPESLADHSFRTTIVGYFLAKLEKVNVEKVVLMCLFHDLHEARTNDLHKVGQRYINFKEAGQKASQEQLSSLGEMGKDALAIDEELHQQKTREAIVARDADYVEAALQAKEYIEIGYKDAQNWLDNCKKCVVTQNAKKLIALIDKTSSNDWWRNLKKIQR